MTDVSSLITRLECYHCGLPVQQAGEFVVQVDGETRQMCCPGCQAVATAIVEGGLASFYRYRTANSARAEPLDTPDSDPLAPWRAFDLPEVQADFVQPYDDGRLQAQLLVENISCAACVWLIEHHLQQQPGIERVSVNASNHRCVVIWDNRQLSLSRIFAELAHIGYRAQPATDDQQQQLWQQENRRALMRLGVAGIGMMQVGMFAAGLYAGGLQGMEEGWEALLRWISLLVATPVVLYSARPFFQAALRSIRTRHLSMDVPVSLAIGGAYLASVWATFRGGGEVYFDSVSMFTFFLLLGRYLEMRARHRNGQALGNLSQLMPLTVSRLIKDAATEQLQSLPLKSLQLGDWVRVKSGETFPCDGVVRAGRSAAVEALLTGEPQPIEKTVGDKVVAGTLNCDSVLDVEVMAVGQGTQLSAIEQLVNQAQSEKPSQVSMADKLASVFVGLVLFVATLVFGFWSWWQPSQALWITLSVLVVTCPCALSLATPAALTAAIARLRSAGLLVTRGHVIENLQQITRVVFDKTGTLTLGELSLQQLVSADGDCVPLSDPAIDSRKNRYLEIAAALEASSNHPIARAFSPYLNRQLAPAKAVQQATGAGVEGEVQGWCYRLGRLDYVAQGWSVAQPEVPADNRYQWLLLGDNKGPLAWFGLSDQLRPSSLAAVDGLRSRGIGVELLSGDPSAAVAELAGQLQLDDYRAGVSPEQKLARVRQLQAQGERVLMVGDGINDVPVLSGADISVAMGSATDLAQTRADSILLSGNLSVLVEALQTSALTRRIIRQNLSWALAYNGLALPLAAAGWVPPYLAALGMSLSSLIVIANAMRLNRVRPEAGAAG